MPPARTEVEYEITRSEFEEVWSASGRRLSKTRTVYNHNGHEVEVDEFPSGLLLAEVEFESVADAEAFTPPPEAEDVTGDISYTNAAIARRPYAKKLGQP
jgi:CYTH domain-containing protein